MKFIFGLLKAKAAQIGERRKWKGGEFEKQAGGGWTRIEAQKHLNVALDRHNLSPKDIDKDTMNEVHEDIEDYHKKVHLGGQDRAEYWKEWAQKHGGAPGKSHKSVVQLAHEMIIQAHGVPTPSARTKLKNKAEAEGKPAPKFTIQPKKAEEEPGKLVPPRKTFKVQPKVKIPKKMIDPLPDNATHTNRFVVEGDSGKDYVIAQSKSTGEWQCDCPAWKYHGHKCKHLDRHLDQLKSLVKQGVKPTERGAHRYEGVKALRQEAKGEKAAPKITVKPKIPVNAAVAKPKADSGDNLAEQLGMLAMNKIKPTDADKKFQAAIKDPKNADKTLKQIHHELFGVKTGQSNDIEVEKKNSAQDLGMTSTPAKNAIIHSRISKKYPLATGHKRDLASMLNGGEYDSKNDRISFYPRGGAGNKETISFDGGKISSYQDKLGVSFGDKAYDKVKHALIRNYA